MTRTYRVAPRIKKRFFREPVMVFDVVMDYQYWYDPSYGNGGGDYRDATNRLATYAKSEDAVEAVRTLGISFSVKVPKEDDQN